MNIYMINRGQIWDTVRFPSNIDLESRFLFFENVNGKTTAECNIQNSRKINGEKDFFLINAINVAIVEGDTEGDDGRLLRSLARRSTFSFSINGVRLLHVPLDWMLPPEPGRGRLSLEDERLATDAFRVGGYEALEDFYRELVIRKGGPLPGIPVEQNFPRSPGLGGHFIEEPPPFGRTFSFIRPYCVNIENSFGACVEVFGSTTTKILPNERFSLRVSLHGEMKTPLEVKKT